MRFRYYVILFCLAAWYGYAYGQTPPTTQPGFSVSAEWQGTKANGYRPAVYAKPTPATHNQALRISDWLVWGHANADGVKALGNDKGAQFSAIEITDVEVTRGYLTDEGRFAKLHSDCIQIDNRGGKPIPLTLRNVSLERASWLIPNGATPQNDAAVIQGLFTIITLDNVRADSAVKIGEVKGTSRAKLVIVKNSPGLRVYTYAGIDAVTVVNSPNAVIKGVDGGSPLVTVEGVTDWEKEAKAQKAVAAALREKMQKIETWLSQRPE